MSKLEDDDDFQNQVVLVSSKVTKLLAELFLEDQEKPPVEATVYGLLKVSAFIATHAKCPDNTFHRLAGIAFKDETKLREQEEENKVLN